MLSLAELGFGSVITQSMYKPVAEGNDTLVCALLNLFRKLYRYIGLIVLDVGLLLMPFLRNPIKGEVPSDVNIYVLFLIFLRNSVSSYWMFAYKSTVLIANQRMDATSKAGIFTMSVLYVLRSSLC